MDKIMIFSQLAHPIRLRLIALLFEHELCVCELEEITDIRQANISKHLSKLKEAKIVDVRRDKQRGFYYITQIFSKETELMQYLSKITTEDEQLRLDHEQFLVHEKTKDLNIYVCNSYKKETLT